MFFSAVQQLTKINKAINQFAPLRITFKVLKYIFLLFAVFWVSSQILTAVLGYERVIKFFYDISNGEIMPFFSIKVNESNIDEVTTIYDSTFYNIFLSLSLLSALAGTFTLSRQRNIFEIIGMLVAFFVPKKRQDWGTIRDINTKEPVPFAIIRLYKLDSKELLLTTVSDLDGKYQLNLALSPETLDLEINANGYMNYEAEISFHEDFSQDYHLSKDQKIDPILGKIFYLQPRLYKYVMFSFYILTFVYLLFAIKYFREFPGSWYGVINLSLFASSFSWNSFILLKRFGTYKGKLIEKNTNKALDGIRLDIYNQDTLQVAGAITNSKGIAQFNVPAGSYDVKIKDDTYSLLSGEILVQAQISNAGFLQRNIFVTKSGRKHRKSQTDNPFE